MMEYIFFDANLRDSFVKHANGLGVACDSRDDSMGLVVAVPEDLDDGLMDAIENYYDELEQEQSRLMSEAEGGLKMLAGLKFVLPDGAECMVPLQPDVAKRLLSCFSLEEIQALFSTVARSALDPKEGHLCAILRSEANKSRQ
jgi:hypothetical protein